MAGPEPYATALPEKIVDGVKGSDVEVKVTSFVLLAEGGGGEDRGVLIEAVFGGRGALVVQALVLGSLLAGAPLSPKSRVVAAAIDAGGPDGVLRPLEVLTPEQGSEDLATGPGRRRRGRRSGGA